MTREFYDMFWFIIVLNDDDGRNVHFVECAHRPNPNWPIVPNICAIFRLCYPLTMIGCHSVVQVFVCSMGDDWTIFSWDMLRVWLSAAEMFVAINDSIRTHRFVRSCAMYERVVALKQWLTRNLNSSEFRTTRLCRSTIPGRKYRKLRHFHGNSISIAAHERDEANFHSCQRRFPCLRPTSTMIDHTEPKRISSTTRGRRCATSTAKRLLPGDT